MRGGRPIDAPAVVRALAAGARAEGAELREGVTVTGLRRSGEDVVGVGTDAGDVHGDAVVIATGAWSAALLAAAGLDVPIGAERLQLIATEPLPVRIGPLVLRAAGEQAETALPGTARVGCRAVPGDQESARGPELLPLLAQHSDRRLLLGCAMGYPAELDDRTTIAGIAAIAQSIAGDYPRSPTRRSRAWGPACCPTRATRRR
jgi:glycine/D-amino acid oxidase-like deaminating enzyme